MNTWIKMLGVMLTITLIVIFIFIAAVFMSTSHKKNTITYSLGSLTLPTLEITQFKFISKKSGMYRLFIRNSSIQNKQSTPQEIINACSREIDLECMNKIFKENTQKEISKNNLLRKCNPNPHGTNCLKVLSRGEIYWEVHNEEGALISKGDYETQGYFDKHNGIPLNNAFKLTNKQAMKITFFPSTKHHPSAESTQIEVIIEIKPE